MALSKFATCCAVLGLIPVQPAFATATWCATVRRDVPGGVLAQRGGPSDTEALVDRLPPSEPVEVDTASCGPRLSEGRAVTGDVCREDGSPWVFIETVPSRATDAGDVAQTRRTTGGWVDSRHLEQVRCAWDEE